MTVAYTVAIDDMLPDMHTSIHNAVASEAAAHVADGHVTGIDHPGAFVARQRACIAVFIDQSIHPACCRVPRAAGLHALTHVHEAPARLRQ